MTWPAPFLPPTVYVHEKGARHLADPARLIDSAARVYGPLLDSLYGRLDPTPPERLHVLGDGEEIEVGPGRTPGGRGLAGTRQAPRRVARLAERGALRRRRRRGQAARRRRPAPGRPRLPTSTSNRHSPHWPSSRARRPSGDRFGPLRPPRRSPRNCWPRPTRRCGSGPRRPRRPIAKGRTSPTALSDRFDPLLGDIDEAHQEKLDTLNGVHSNAAGFRRWLEGRDAAPAP